MLLFVFLSQCLCSYAHSLCQILVYRSVLSPVSHLSYKRLWAKPIPLKMNERIQRLPCVKGAVALATEGLFPAIWGFFTIPPSAFGCHLPLHKGGFLFTHYNTNRQRKQVLCRGFYARKFSAKNAERTESLFSFNSCNAQASKLGKLLFFGKSSGKACGKANIVGGCANQNIKRAVFHVPVL